MRRLVACVRGRQWTRIVERAASLPASPDGDGDARWRLQNAFSDVIRSAFRWDSITIPTAFDHGFRRFDQVFRNIRSRIPTIRSAFRSIRSPLARQPKGQLGIVAAHEATVHAKNPRSSEIALRLRLHSPANLRRLQHLIVHCQ